MAFKPWSWYGVAVLLMLIIVMNVLIYGFVGPFFINLRDTLAFWLGVLIVGPVSLAANLFTIRLFVKAIKSLINGPSADSKENGK